MELEITGKKENKTLQRQEIELTAKDAKITPSRKELRPKIAALVGAKEELVVIEKIGHTFGKREAKIKVHIYENKEALEKAEPKYLVDRDLGKKKGKKGEKKKAEGTPAEGKEEKKEGKEKKPEEGEKAAEGKEKPDEKKEAKAEEKKKEGDK